MTGLILSSEFVLDQHRLSGGGIANQNIDAMALTFDCRVFQPEVLDADDGLQKIRQIPQGRVTRLPVIEKRREKPGVQIHLVTLGTQNREDVEGLLVSSPVPLI